MGANILTLWSFGDSNLTYHDLTRGDLANDVSYIAVLPHYPSTDFNYSPFVITRY